ncbi:MAG: translation initiation factor IF-2 [Cenarchaeum sp. SB0666_bin_15]|nr:translation initiation factor IF-2 [Cenarchaeum sp. SB0666_bin_15]MYJ28066.1 translation initiation factor IF-2 [Cenarchaeum sp. SB0672_bin_9]
MVIRQPIVAVLGHVDSGKTSLLDKIRGTGVQGREAGGITQHIGASFLPHDTVKKTCGRLYDRLKSDSIIPGILVIDTPGHEVFKNLRSRGGSAADIAILVVDAARGFQPQTQESFKILKSRKVPFVIALNKCDQISGWRGTSTPFISEAVKEQDETVRTELDRSIYDIVGTLSILGYKSEVFYRVKDFRSEVSIIPISAKTGVGIPELLTVLVALTQQYMKNRLEQDEKEARGIILEANHETGLGETANIILIDGIIKKDNHIIMAKRDGIIVTKPKAILLPKPLDEMRDPRDKFQDVDYVRAAAGLKIASPDLDGVLPGSTLYVAKNEGDIKMYSDMIRSEMESVFIDTQTRGVTLKCDTIGSLEAMVQMLNEKGVQIAKADIGPVNRRDVMEARATKDVDRRLGVILAFNVKVFPDATEEADVGHVRIFQERVIYKLIDDYTEWVRQDIIHEEDAVFAEITPLAKFTFLKGYTFRNSNPAVFGIRIEGGTLRSKTPFMNTNGRRVGIIHQLQHDGKTIQEVRTGQEVACSVRNVTIGRHIFEEDVYHTLPTSTEAKNLKGRFIDRLSSEQISMLDHIIDVQREQDAAYAY